MRKLEKAEGDEMNHEKQQLKSILDQYAEGTIHMFEMLERALSTITPADLKQHFMVAPVEFDEKLGLAAQAVDHKKEMQQFAAGLLRQTAGLLAETFDGFVPTITVNADATVTLVELDVRHPAHFNDPDVLPTTTRVLKFES